MLPAFQTWVEPAPDVRAGQRHGRDPGRAVVAPHVPAGDQTEAVNAESRIVLGVSNPAGDVTEERRRGVVYRIPFGVVRITRRAPTTIRGCPRDPRRAHRNVGTDVRADSIPAATPATRPAPSCNPATPFEGAQPDTAPARPGWVTSPGGRPTREG